VLEALLFAADEPITVRQIRRIFPEAEAPEVRRLLEELREEYDRDERSFHLREIEGGWQLFTREAYFPWIRKLRADWKAMRLSRAAIETLAIVAYRQPVMRSEIEQIRGVDAGGVLKTLLERNLVTIRGRAEGVGRPLLYGTTDFFLNHFGLKGLDDLPKIEELTELMKSEDLSEIEAEVEGILGPAPLVVAGDDEIKEEEAPPPEEHEPEEPWSADGEEPAGDALAAGDR